MGREFADASRDDAIMGLDIERFGDDRSVACIRRGPAVIGLWVFPSSDVMTTTGRALDLARVHKVVKINVDEVGLGAGVLDRMRELAMSSQRASTAVGALASRSDMQTCAPSCSTT